MRVLLPINNALTKILHDGSLPHKHVFWELIIFIKGKCLHHVQGKTITCNRGDVFIVGPKHIHNIELIDEPHQHRDLYFTDTHFKEICDLINIKDLYKQLCDDVFYIHLQEPLLQHILSQLTTVESYDILNLTNPDQTTAQDFSICCSVCDSILYFLLGNHALNHLHQEQSRPEWILTLLLNLNNPTFFIQKPSEIINKSGYSHSRFSELFKKYTGFSLADYLIRQRLQYASTLLLESKKNILEICTLAGYDSYSCFVRLFKKQFHMSPLKYRQQHQGD